jgi:hypothetical protein
MVLFFSVLLTNYKWAICIANTLAFASLAYHCLKEQSIDDLPEIKDVFDNHITLECTCSEKGNCEDFLRPCNITVFNVYKGLLYCILSWASFVAFIASFQKNPSTDWPAIVLIIGFIILIIIFYIILKRKLDNGEYRTLDLFPSSSSSSSSKGNDDNNDDNDDDDVKKSTNDEKENNNDSDDLNLDDINIDDDSDDLNLDDINIDDNDSDDLNLDDINIPDDFDLQAESEALDNMDLSIDLPNPDELIFDE